jgi:hypothetical protein
MAVKFIFVHSLPPRGKNGKFRKRGKKDRTVTTKSGEVKSTKAKKGTKKGAKKGSKKGAKKSAKK